MSPSRMWKSKIFTSSDRLKLTVIFIILIVAAVASRLFFIQIISHQAYLDLAKKQQGFSRILEPKRGDIYYKNKNGELAKAATTKVGSLLYLNTKLLKESENTFNKLNAVTSIDRDLFNKIVKKINNPYEILAWKNPNFIKSCFKFLKFYLFKFSHDFF